MSKFKNERFYIIIPDEDITTDILNYSSSKSKTDAPSKTSGGILMRILEFPEPGPEIISIYTWYDQDGIVTAWNALP